MKKLIFISAVIISINFISFSQTAVRFPAQDFTHESSISSIVRASGNQLILFWFDNDAKKLFMSKSSDNGTTWSDKVHILQNYSFGQDTIKELNVISTLPSNLILVFKLKTTSNLFYYSISENNGLSWSEPLPIYFAVTPLQSVKGFYSSLGELSNGTILFTHSFISGTIPRGVYYSKFVNNNWTTHQLLDSTGIWGFIFSPSSGKEMVIYSDLNGNKTDLYFRTSTDLGISWSAEQLLLTTPYSKSRPRVVKSNNGHIYIFYEEMIPTSFNNFYQKEIYYISSSDNGLSWSSPVRVTKFMGDDNYLSATSTNSNEQIIAFTSSRNSDLNYSRSQTYIISGTESFSPPTLVYNNPLPDTLTNGSSLTINVFADDYSQIENVKLIVDKLAEADTFDMYDDGLHQDSLAGDKIYGYTLNNLTTGAYHLYVSIKNNHQLFNVYRLGKIIIPTNNVINSYLLELNKIKLPLTYDGVLADVTINGVEGARYEDKSFLFSGGFYIAGKNQNQWWANGIASASRIQDYLPGLPGFPDDPRNILYVVKASDPPFGNSCMPITFPFLKYAVS
ncbi:MAG: exo-alpha-sialidase, partial [Ignavibacterium sp.]|uniref:sialidase family protein n=1 Tax=Ignavibacterium sp. TaxID=2651167 RepID=UPI003299C943